MSAEVITHAKFEDTYDEPRHPIPSVDTLDVNVVKKGGGSDLLIVIASPLMADDYSKGRLLTRLRNYCLFLSTPDFRSESGESTPDNTSIIVELHPDSHPEILELLESQQDVVFSHGASLKLRILSASELGPSLN
ncbi:MAG: hypothetical protein KGJ94_08735 [Xanthomonadaceae bacterium]|nr:hypothetical protein [Xanthomonadaceae bacterium]